MAVLENIAGGFGVAFAVLGVLAISNGISTYVFNGETLESKVMSRVGA